ncbi:MAG: ATP-binding cassette domain-containing protein [Clostridia bacterium]|nr:ATP-binding cassette domain-containing protein [Clostridia bacterium]
MKLELKDLCKSFGGRKVLDGITLSFEPGIYALLGPNGAGKTTLINILMRNLREESGSIRVDGEELACSTERYRSRIGFMPQQQPLPAYYPAERFLYYVAALKGLDRGTAEKQIPEVLHMTNMWDRRKDKLGKLSGGMKQRILIAQALLGSPELLILDEPTAGLDPKERVRIRNLISRISADRIVLIATHLASDVECIATRLLFLRQGKLIDNISPDEMETRLKDKVYEFSVGFGEADTYLDDNRVSAMMQESGGIRVRMVTDTPPAETAVAVTPHLEDMYLDLFRKDV